MKLFLLPMLILSAFSIYAQKEVPEFGNFSNEDISLSECDFDKDADAIVLFDVANSSYNDEYNLITSRRIRLKILKEKGLERANIEIHYQSKDHFEDVSNTEAISYTLGDNAIVSNNWIKKLYSDRN